MKHIAFKYKEKRREVHPLIINVVITILVNAHKQLCVYDKNESEIVADKCFNTSKIICYQLRNKMPTIFINICGIYFLCFTISSLKFTYTNTALNNVYVTFHAIFLLARVKAYTQIKTN